MSEKFFNKTKYLNISHYNRHYSYIVANPVCSLTDEQYSPVSDAFNVLRAISSMCKECRESMMLNLLHAIIMMRYNFCPIPTEAKKKRDNRISARFQEAVVEHYRESRDVAFYARMFGLSPKYFAVLVKKELHVSPGQWISNYVVMRAKEMLDKRGDLNIQQIALELGFDMQSAFSRFFKNNTGVTPKEYRK